MGSTTCVPAFVHPLTAIVTLSLIHDGVSSQDELGLSRELMFKLPLEKRWEVYLSKQKVRVGNLQKCEYASNSLVPVCVQWVW